MVNKKSAVEAGKKTVTVRGVKVTVDPARFDDVDFLYKLRDVQKEENLFLLLDIIDDMLGIEQRTKLVDGLRDENGRASATALGEALEELFAAIPK
ncbi:hypothetical protein R6G85_02400 [Actinotignum urinale]|uniref:Tail assembly chaperone n=1 Tax=Actinotignum urinale TaxID=190146 RepID=A0AAW9HK41_9ACTO|nr:hypothetical protein [Actinotignum urinale]MDY5132239.1 hypothetical protein [Actinotignum urinale]MDY5151338.1 hypothetical protein [Actinotignum urinale]MDY5154281.1 hypothetical protein [Actinotignum urinale]WIK58861.1 hypothetical protein CJ184_006340 [Actinotignum urinale]